MFHELKLCVEFYFKVNEILNGRTHTDPHRQCRLYIRLMSDFNEHLVVLSEVFISVLAGPCDDLLPVCDVKLLEPVQLFAYLLTVYFSYYDAPVFQTLCYNESVYCPYLRSSYSPWSVSYQRPPYYGSSEYQKQH